jgi:hypothetical protein
LCVDVYWSTPIAFLPRSCIAAKAVSVGRGLLPPDWALSEQGISASAMIDGRRLMGVSGSMRV